MRFLIAVETQSAQWNMAITCRDDPAWQRNRQMAKLEDVGGWHFPAPLSLPVAGAPHYDLCLPENDSARRAAYTSIVNRQAVNVVEKFGRYLFESLLGDAIWQAITDKAEQAGAPFIELALRWPNAKEYKSLHRLPWEMMHGARGFLAQGHTTAQGRLIEVAVTRIVAGAEFDARPLSLPPRVLFVMGTRPDDPAIRPGAEIMGLLRQLKREGRGIHSREISEAKPSQLHEVVEDFRPDLVHFICHGNVAADGRGYLELVPEKPGESNRQFADQIVPKLRAGQEQRLPALVVLSACYSAGLPNAGKTLTTAEMAPLAAELVAGGVPIVVGMSGRVSDRACRLFTRRFGDAIVKGDPLILTTAQGRRSIFVEGQSAYASVDWAFPAIFLSENVESNYTPVPSLQAMPRVIVETRIESYDLDRPPIFCSRNKFFDDYYQLVSKYDPDEYYNRYTERKPSVLAIYGEDGMGKTRLLEELTAQAIRDGHLPIPIIVKGGLAEPPREFDALREALFYALDRACGAFDLQMPPDSQLANPLKQETARTLKQALQSDIAYALEQAHQQTPAMRAIVLLDEVQQYKESFLSDLFDWTKNMLGNFGLGTKNEPIPLVVAFSPGGGAAGIMKKVLENPPTWLRARPLECFSSKGEDLLVYQRVLLHPFLLEAVPGISDKPWVVNDEAEEKITARHQDKFRRYLKGLPARLADDRLFLLAEDAAYEKYLIEADDERLLQLLGGGS